MIGFKKPASHMKRSGRQGGPERFHAQLHEASGLVAVSLCGTLGRGDSGVGRGSRRRRAGSALVLHGLVCRRGGRGGAGVLGISQADGAHNSGCGDDGCQGFRCSHGVLLWSCPSQAIGVGKSPALLPAKFNLRREHRVFRRSGTAAGVGQARSQNATRLTGTGTSKDGLIRDHAPVIGHRGYSRGLLPLMPCWALIAS